MREKKVLLFLFDTESKPSADCGKRCGRK